MPWVSPGIFGVWEAYAIAPDDGMQSAPVPA